jgi:hypothetical protein
LADEFFRYIHHRGTENIEKFQTRTDHGFSPRRHEVTRRRHEEISHPDEIAAASHRAGAAHRGYCFKTSIKGFNNFKTNPPRSKLRPGLCFVIIVAARLLS